MLSAWVPSTGKGSEMESIESYPIAGIDMHKKMLAVVVTDAAIAGECRFEQRKFGTGDSELAALAAWLRERGVREAVMESTAQYWKPVWREVEPQCKLYLAEAQPHPAPKGRKRDFADAPRLAPRHLPGALLLIFPPHLAQ